MHLFNMATVLVVISLVSVELSVAAFVDPPLHGASPPSRS